MLHITMLFAYRNDLKLVNSFITVDRLLFLELAFFSPKSNEVLELAKHLHTCSNPNWQSVHLFNAGTCSAPFQPSGVGALGAGLHRHSSEAIPFTPGLPLQSTEQNTIPL